MAGTEKGSSAFERLLHRDGKLSFSRLASAGHTVAGLLLFVIAALAAARLFGHSPVKQYVPLGFIAILVVLTSRFGAIVGLLGTLMVALVFAYYLFPPLGSFRVEDGSARANLAWMVLAAIAISFLAFPPQDSSRHR